MMAGIEELHNMRTALVHVEVDVAFFQISAKRPMAAFRHSSVRFHGYALSGMYRCPDTPPSWRRTLLGIKRSPWVCIFQCAKGVRLTFPVTHSCHVVSFSVLECAENLYYAPLRKRGLLLSFPPSRFRFHIYFH